MKCHKVGRCGILIRVQMIMESKNYSHFPIILEDISSLASTLTSMLFHLRRKDKDCLLVEIYILHVWNMPECFTERFRMQSF